jgi:hypothetical protein
MTWVDSQTRLNSGVTNTNVQLNSKPAATYKPEKSVDLMFTMSLLLYQTPLKEEGY